jgi:hypothetical protein
MGEGLCCQHCPAGLFSMLPTRPMDILIVVVFSNVLGSLQTAVIEAVIVKLFCSWYAVQNSGGKGEVTLTIGEVTLTKP